MKVVNRLNTGLLITKSAVQEWDTQSRPKRASSLIGKDVLGLEAMEETESAPSREDGCMDAERAGQGYPPQHL